MLHKICNHSGIAELIIIRVCLPLMLFLTALEKFMRGEKGNIQSYFEGLDRGVLMKF